MTKKSRYECIDVGSEYCPCYLAETNDCITCSHLQGKSFCDCDWKGVCVFQEYTWNNNKAKMARSSTEVKILEKRKIGENLLILKVFVGKTLARQLRQPGSYVFLRNINKPHYFDMPMSIMDSNENTGEVEIAIQIIGSKTKSLLDANETILLRGPYWNGLLGLKNLKGLQGSNVIMVARGVALAPAVLVAKYLLHNNNKITFIMDKGKIDNYFIYDYIQDLNIVNIEADIISEKGQMLLAELIKNNNYKLCYSGGSNTQHEKIKQLLKDLSPETKLSICNNNEICCGEGVCGACSKKVDKKVFKTCKTQIDSMFLIK